MKPQTCCCHICKTSLNQYKREFLPCTACNKIVCKNCFGTKFKASTWEESYRVRLSWLCPSCSGTCVCPRCRKKPTVFGGKISPMGSEEFKPSHKEATRDRNRGSSGRDRERDRDLRNSFDLDMDYSNSRESSPEPAGYHHSRVHIGSPTNSTGNTSPIRNSEKYKFKVEKLFFVQLQELVDREKRCEGNIKEMSRLLQIMRREKEIIVSERSKLEEIVTEQKIRGGHSNNKSNILNSSSNEYSEFAATYANLSIDNVNSKNSMMNNNNNNINMNKKQQYSYDDEEDIESDSDSGKDCSGSIDDFEEETQFDDLIVT